MSENLLVEDGWVPTSCTLPTVDRPLRQAEFDDLVARDVLSVHQPSSDEIRFELRADPEVAARAASLAARETGCCSFFVFTLTISKGIVGLSVSAEPAHASVLAAMSARAQARIVASA